MDTRLVVLLLLCWATVALAGCTSHVPSADIPAHTPSVIATTGSGIPADSMSCTAYAGCVPAQCCHPTGCALKTAAPDCSGTLCTESCEGPIDCGAGSCRCINGTCAVVPVQTIAVKLTASPQRYSPVMSSTVGIGLTPDVTGFMPANTTSGGNTSDFAWNTINYEWNATFGRFLMWDAPDYKVHEIGNPVATSGKVYWTFTEKPALIKDPVVITVTARDMTRRGAVLGNAMVTLGWDGDSAVIAQDVR